MQFNGSIQEAMAACTLRRQPLLLAVVEEQDQLEVIKDAKLVGRCLYHVVMKGSDEHAQVDGLCNEQIKKVVPRVHVFPPQARGLGPTVFLGDQLTPEILRQSVLVASEWTKDECTKGVRSAMDAARGITNARKAAGSSSPQRGSASVISTASTATGVKKKDQEGEADDMPKPAVRVSDADAAAILNRPATGRSLPALPVEMPDGRIQKMQFHEKATLNLVRKRVLAEGSAHGVENEFFHFAVCSTRTDGRDTCQKIVKREEDQKSLKELGLSLVRDGEEAPTAGSGGHGATLKVVSDAGSPGKTVQDRKVVKNVPFMYPGAKTAEEVSVDGDLTLSALWEKLREPSGDWMFLPAAKRKVTREEAKGLKADILFREARIMLLYAPAATKPAGATAVRAHVDPMAGPSASPPREDDAVPSPANKETPSPTSGEDQPDKDIQVKLIFPTGGAPVIHTINDGLQLVEIKKFVVEQEKKAGATEDQAATYRRTCQLQLAYPPRRFVDADDTVPLRALKISNLSTIRVTYSSDGGSSGGGGDSAPAGSWFGAAKSGVSKVAGWIPGLGGSGGSGGPKEADRPQPKPTSSSSGGGGGSTRQGAVHRLNLNQNDDDDEDGSEDEDGNKKKPNRYYGGTSTEYQDKK